MSKGIAELERLAKEFAGDKLQLEKLRDELKFRTTKKAKDLLGQVVGQIVRISEESSGDSGRSRKSGTREAEPNEKQGKIDELLQTIVSLKERIRRLENELGRNQNGFVKVGLHPTCPDFLLKAARNAYRKELHPDKHPGASAREKAEIGRQFGEIEEAFEKLFDERKMN
jgi:hypothetical protein